MDRIINWDDLKKPDEQWQAIQSKAFNAGLGLKQEIDENQTVTAFINHGRWIVTCPFCPGAELASKTNPVFICQSCWNSEIGGKQLTVLFPEKVKDIEDALTVRPLDNRNWETTETVETLLADNELYIKPKKVKDGLDIP
jgi:hypothetical protein